MHKPSAEINVTNFQWEDFSGEKSHVGKCVDTCNGLEAGVWMYDEGKKKVKHFESDALVFSAVNILLYVAIRLRAFHSVN